MTREEQIKKQAQIDECCYVANNYDSFKRGVKWADENPKDGLVNIDKVCEYLNKNIFQSYTYNARNKIGCLTVNNKFVNKDSFFEAFRKAMEK